MPLGSYTSLFSDFLLLLLFTGKPAYNIFTCMLDKAILQYSPDLQIDKYVCLFVNMLYVTLVNVLLKF